MELREEKVFWNVLRLIFRLLATNEGQLIMRALLNEDNIRTNTLLKVTNLEEYRFHPVMRQLVKNGIVTRKVSQDTSRSVSYSISPLGKHILKLSHGLLDKIKESVDEGLIVEA